MVEHVRNQKAAEPTTPAKKVATPVIDPRTGPRPPVIDPKTDPGPQPLGLQSDYTNQVQAERTAPLTDAEKAQKKAQEESNKVEIQAQETATKMNISLINDGDPRRVMGSVRNGKVVYWWGNFVPTQAMTEYELEYAQGMRKGSYRGDPDRPYRDDPDRPYRSEQDRRDKAAAEAAAAEDARRK